MDLPTSDRITLVVSHAAEEAHSWDEFLFRHPDAHIEQTIAWGRLKQIYGWKPVWVWVDRGGKRIGGAMILTRRLGGLVTMGYVERGPVWDPAEDDSMEIVARALYKAAASLHITYLVVVPPYCGDSALPLLQSMQFRPKPESLPPTGVGRATLLIDLRQSVDEMFADLSMTKRQNIRRAIRKGVKVRVGDGVDADTVRDLMWAGCRRRGVRPSPPQLDFFDNLWRLMGRAEQVRFFLAEIDGQPVAAGVTHVFHGMMQLWRVGWSGTHPEWHPNDLLHWEMLKWGHENGCHTFDFMHIQPEDARALLSGEKTKNACSGITEFKTGFGGQLRLLPELHYRSFNPIVHSALKLGAARILASGIYENLLEKIHSRMVGAGSSVRAR